MKWNIWNISFCIPTGNCGGNYTGPSGSFSSPSFPRNYPLDTICNYHINVHAGKSVSLSFRNFSLEDSNNCKYDRVEIIDGSDNKKYCGTALPPSYNSKTNSVTVKFVSDYSQVSKGFFLQYHTAASKWRITYSKFILINTLGQHHAKEAWKTLMQDVQYCWGISSAVLEDTISTVEGVQ